ncbi:MAG TPA: hypothetical protein VN950_02680 [Terriglobales bacterium]|nr:hypothetical protein [Terriglobales bacterium]
MARHNEGLAAQSSLLHDDQLQKLVGGSCARIQTELTRRAPFLGEQVRGWMAHLSPTGVAPDYFLQPRMFPILRLPLWAAKSLTAEPDGDFLADVIYSTVNGYYYIRLLDNLMDGHGTIELKILPATAFFHTEFQATYQKYFDAAHPFWEVFRSAWFSASDAVTHEFNLDRIREAEFERITVAKLAGVRIPLAAVGFRYGTGQGMQRWENFALALARWSQMEDDLFDWHQDLCHGKTSYFLSEANRCKGFDTVDAWVIHEGFHQGVETLQRELSALRDLLPPLHSPDVASYLDLRETMLEGQKTQIGEAFRVLETVAIVTEAPRAQTSD